MKEIIRVLEAAFGIADADNFGIMTESDYEYIESALIKFADDFIS